jgi:mannose-6-phosphate isomerase
VSGDELARPLRLRPVYKELVWGGRRMARWRADLPSGPIGESWDVADHPDGTSVVADGPLAGASLSELMATRAEALVGPGYQGRTFPLMVKLIDATDRLSVQVHPDDVLARRLGVGDNGKTECWLFLEDGGSLFQGTRAGVERAAFERALAAGAVAEALNVFEPRAGDFFFLEARTVHALGAGCLLYEIQQTSNVTFRVWDWGRLGLDGKPRPVHLAESLETIEFGRDGFGPRRPPWALRSDGEEARALCDCSYFSAEERRGRRIVGTALGRVAVVTCLEGAPMLATAAGSMALGPMQTALVPAVAGPWWAESSSSCRLLISSPRL